MIISSIQAYVFSVPTDFKIACWDIRFSRHCVVILTVDGVPGCGCAPLYSTRPWTVMQLLRQEIVPFLEEASFSNLSDLRSQIDQRFLAKSSPLVLALDAVLRDMEVQLAGQSFGQGTVLGTSSG